ncbi:MAG: hypothetical protein JKY56_23605, partial [Kofleriaceae bacterium]|nr:hypothetical protein [Kofleriaceae bacterium]
MRRTPTTPRNCLAFVLVIGIAGLGGSCATASVDEQIVDPPKPDAGIFTPADARTVSDATVTDAALLEAPDAQVPIDAAVVVPDAEIGALFCDVNTDCAS